MNLSKSHKKILNNLTIKPLDAKELAQLLKMNQNGMRARVSELRKMGFKIEVKYILSELDFKAYNKYHNV